MEWVAESITPVTAFKLQYKEDYYTYTSLSDLDDLENGKGWTEVKVAPVSNGDGFYSGKHVVENLRPATRYLARVSSRNDYGYSNFGPPIRFGTKGAGKL